MTGPAPAKPSKRLPTAGSPSKPTSPRPPAFTASSSNNRLFATSRLRQSADLLEQSKQIVHVPAFRDLPLFHTITTHTTELYFLSRRRDARQGAIVSAARRPPFYRFIALGEHIV